MSFDAEISKMGMSPKYPIAGGKPILSSEVLAARPATRPLSATIPHAAAPIAFGAYGEIRRPKPETFRPEKGFTNHYTKMEKGSKWAAPIARGHVRYARFMKRDDSDFTPFSELPQATIVRKTDGKLTTRTYGNPGTPASKEILIMARMINNSLNSLGLECNDNGYYSCPKTGTVLRLIFEPTTKEVCVSFYGLRMGDDETRAKIRGRNVLAAMKEFFGGVPLAATQAAEIGAAVKKFAEAKGYQAVMIGHSHGGGLAQAAAVANGLKGVVFNSRPMGAGVRRHFRKQVEEHADKITAFTGKGDWLGGSRLFNGIARFLEKIGISAPRTIGYGYNLPEAPGEERKSGAERLNYQHNKFLKQLKEVSGEEA